MNTGVDVGQGVLARNTVYNLLGQGLPLLVALVAVPVLLRGLGDGAFGVLGLVWMFAALFGDVGFGRAGTRFVADALGSGRANAVAGILRTTLRGQLVLGVMLGAAVAAGAGALVSGVFDVPGTLAAEATRSFLWLALATPFLTLGAGYRGALEAAQRFGVLNAWRFVGNTLGYLLPILAVRSGLGLEGVVVLVLGVRVALTGAFALAWGRAAPTPGPGGPATVATREVLAFGGWVLVSTVVSPVLIYLDRFVLGAVTGVEAVGLYTAPYEMVMRVLLVPGAMAATLFPALSALGGMGRDDEARHVARRAVGVIALLLGPVALAAVLWAHPAMSLWLGSAYQPASGTALRLLAPGVLLNALAYVPFSVLQGLGRADLTARFHLAELPVHVVVTWFLVGEWGVAGAAAAWTVRAALDAALLFGGAAVVLRRRRTA